eukprot:g3816.t1
MENDFHDYQNSDDFIHELDELFYSIKDRLELHNMPLLENRFWFKYKMWTGSRNASGEHHDSQLDSATSTIMTREIVAQSFFDMIVGMNQIAMRCLSESTIPASRTDISFRLNSRQKLKKCDKLLRKCRNFLEDKAIKMHLTDEVGITAWKWFSLSILTLNNFSCYFRSVKKDKLAKNALKDAIRIGKQEYHGQELPLEHLAVTHLNMCAILSEKQQHEKALGHAEAAVFYSAQDAVNFEVLEKAGSKFADEHVSFNEIMVTLAASYHSCAVELEYLGQKLKAFRWYKKASQLVEKHAGEMNPLYEKIISSYNAVVEEDIVRKHRLEEAKSSTANDKEKKIPNKPVQIKNSNFKRPRSTPQNRIFVAGINMRAQHFDIKDEGIDLLNDHEREKAEEFKLPKDSPTRLKLRNSKLEKKDRTAQRSESQKRLAFLRNVEHIRQSILEGIRFAKAKEPELAKGFLERGLKLAKEVHAQNEDIPESVIQDVKEYEGRGIEAMALASKETGGHPHKHITRLLEHAVAKYAEANSAERHNGAIKYLIMQHVTAGNLRKARDLCDALQGMINERGVPRNDFELACVKYWSQELCKTDDENASSNATFMFLTGRKFELTLFEKFYTSSTTYREAKIDANNGDTKQSSIILRSRQHKKLAMKMENCALLIQKVYRVRLAWIRTNRIKEKRLCL